MTISPSVQRRIFASLNALRTQMWDQQEQLSTGKRAQTYSKLGINRSVAIDARRLASNVEGYQNTIRDVGNRLKAMEQTLERFGNVGQELRSALSDRRYILSNGTQTQGQVNAKIYAEEVVSIVNQDFGGRKLFSGRAVTDDAVENVDIILNGDGAKAGLKQVITERKAADLGTGNSGRLTTSTLADTVTIAEDGIHPFGFKLSSITSSNTGVTTTQPTGSPQTESLTFTQIPIEGDILSFKFTLPDGSNTTLQLKATALTPKEGEYQIGVDLNTNASNVLSSLNTSLLKLATTELSSASATQGSEDFFSNPQKRVSGTPETATALVDGTAANTIKWYTGEDAGDNPRQTSVAVVDEGQRVGYGARATEAGIKKLIQSSLLMAAESFSETETNGQIRYDALASRANDLAFDAVNGSGGILSIRASLGTTHSIMNSTNERHKARIGLLQDSISEVEDISNEEVATRLLAVSNTLEATYQVTAKLSQISILNYI